MNTLNISADRSSAKRVDFVTTDAVELASHMSHCASSRGRFFVLRSALQASHALVSGRIITVAAFVVIGTGLLALV